MFDTIKQQVNLLQEISDDTNREIVESGTNTYKFLDDQEAGCTFCGHKDCLKFFFDENVPQDANFHCFSCSARGDIIEWHAKRKNLEPGEAARFLAAAYKIDLPARPLINPIQEIFDLAARYYQTCLKEARPQTKLGGLTPHQYQLESRLHKPETLDTFQVGWSDGGLYDYFSGLGFDDELIQSSGLISKKTGKDFLPYGVFIYPHKVGGKVSHFTFKDPAKKLAYQLPNKYVLNGYEFYGQDTVKGKESVIIVEGENDLLSTFEADDFPENCGILATIGSLSGAQVDWIRDNLADRTIITLFDPDEAGNKYRSRMDRIGRGVKKLVQFKPHEDKDIDEVLKSGGSLTEILTKFTPVSSAVKVPTAADLLSRITSGEKSGEENPVVEDDTFGSDCSIVERGGCYYRLKHNKESEPTFVRISDFTMQLLRVHIKENGERHRQIVVKQRNGKQSEPFFVTSGNKVSLGPFKTLMANAADVSFKGSEMDLADMWQLVYEKGSETEVHETRVVGWNETLKSWIFRNLMITSTGEVITPDENGVFWISGRKIGVKPESLTEELKDASDIPELDTSLSKEECNELMKGIIENLSRNISSLGNALLLLGWAKACLYSNWIHSNRVFPFLYFWGSKGEGKTTIIKWIQRFYGIGDTGYTSVRMLGSTVSFIRKTEYYSSLPLIIDEMRADQETERHISLFRTFYDRTPRSVAANNTYGIRTQQIRSCFAYIGEDQVEDPAFRERCFSIRVPVNGRETKETYEWMENHKDQFSNIAYYWFLESLDCSMDEIQQNVKEFDKKLVMNGCTKRNSKNWAAAAFFADQIAKEFCPDFDFIGFVVGAATKDAEVQREESTLASFFNLVEMLKAEENSPITNEVMKVEGDKLHLWFIQLFRFINKDSRQGFPFSRKAVMEALKDEPYFVKGTGSTRVQMGLDGDKRAVITLDLTKAPDYVKSAAGYDK